MLAIYAVEDAKTNGADTYGRTNMAPVANHISTIPNSQVTVEWQSESYIVTNGTEGVVGLNRNAAVNLIIDMLTR